MGIVYGDDLRSQVSGIPLLIGSQGMNPVDSVPMGKEVRQQHDPPSPSGSEGGVRVARLHIGSGPLDEEGIGDKGQAAPLFTVDLDRNNTDIVQGPPGNGNTARHSHPCARRIKRTEGLPCGGCSVDSQCHRHGSGRVRG